MKMSDVLPDDVSTGACSPAAEEPAILEEIEVEDLAVDGICGVY
jgi:mycofactocin precursor